jgi:peptidoglycan/xylan/chitin deacetylase (PgdA/CDA1 family)
VKRRLRLALVVLLLAGAVLVVWLASRSHEPVHQGLKLSEWASRLEFNFQYTMAYDYTLEQRLQAEEAIWTIGTNAMPFHITRIKKEESASMRKLRRQLARSPASRLADYLPADDKSDISAAIQIIGARAMPWLGELESIATNSSREVSRSAAGAISAIRCEEAASVLGRFLNTTNAPEPRTIYAGLSDLGWRSRAMVPQIMQGLRDTNYVRKWWAAWALDSISVAPEAVIPALTERLNDTNKYVRGAVIDALASFGNTAIDALPTIDAGPAATGIDPERLATAKSKLQQQIRNGAVIRGSVHQKRIALVFTGHEFAEGGTNILDALAQRKLKASFFVTGVFLARADFQGLIARIKREGHLLGPHSDQHLLYCSWEDSSKTLVERHEFRRDFYNNLRRIAPAEFSQKSFPEPDPSLGSSYFLPPYEHYNRDIADWTRELGRTLINFTPGTRSNADYTGEADKNFVSSQAIFDSIVKKEREDPHGLNGFILLLHLGAGPGRQDKFHHRFGELLDYLSGKGYQFVRVDELLETKEINETNSANP